MSIDAAAFRKVMGNFATGVTVVTTRVDDVMHGITANAVTSVSLEPMLILVCIDKDANAHGELARAPAFGVSILSEGQEDVSNLFASSGEPQTGSLRGAAYRLGQSGAPILEGAIASLECEAEQSVDAGDHTIFLGRVLAAEVLSEEAPLLYFRGKYRRVGA